MTKQDINVLYRLIEDLLLRKNIDPENIFKTLIDVNTVSIELNSWCLSNINESIKQEICFESFKLIDKAIDNILKFLTIQFIENKIKLRNDVISQLINIILDSYSFFKNIFRDAMITQDGKILCKVLKPISISDVTVARGYVVLMPINLASILSALKYVEPIYISTQIKT